MTLPDLRRKLPPLGPGVDWDRQEDPLTAEVLGAWRYLPFELGAGPVLAQARNERGETLASWFPNLRLTEPGLVARLHFWPALVRDKEPDLLVSLWRASACDPEHPPVAAFLVEVKLGADQHWIEGMPQLAWYLARLQKWEWKRPAEIGLPPPPDRRAVVYLTNQPSLPGQDLMDARQHAAKALDDPGKCLTLFWAGWRQVARTARDLHQGVGETPGQPWLRHLPDMVVQLARRGISPREDFTGMPLPKPLPCAPYPRSSGLPRLGAVRLPVPPYRKCHA